MVPAPPSSHGRSTRFRGFTRALTRTRYAIRSIHPSWFVSAVLLFYIILRTFVLDNTLVSFDPTSLPDRAEDLEATVADDDLRMRNRLENARQSNFTSTEHAFRGPELGNKFCIMQPTLSVGKSHWHESEVKQHIALRAFMRTFAETITQNERENFKFAIYYGFDSDDRLFGNEVLRRVFRTQAMNILLENGFTEEDVEFIFTPVYALHGRLNAIWNVLAKDAYYDNCDYFFLSNDDMVFFTRGWVSRSVDSLNGVGAPARHKRPCRGMGIVRFKDEWANWATFTFHVSTRLHLEIFGGVYYPVPYHSAHNDYWINFVYRSFDASKYRGEIRVRNRVEDVDYALAHQKDHDHIAPARYTYDKRGHAALYIHQGMARVKTWLDKYRHTERCQPPL